MTVLRRRRSFAFVNLQVEVGFKDQTSSMLAKFAEEGTVNADGTQHSPERPILRPTMANMDAKIKQAGRAMVRAVNRGRSPMHAARELAEDLEDELRRQIDEAQPPNAESTIKQKGFDDPLRGPSRPNSDEPGDRIMDGVTSKIRRLT